MGNPKFDEIRRKHPDWSDEQVWAAVSISMEADNTVEKAGKDIDPNNPEILRSIIKGAQEWLKAVLPQIFEKLKALFNQLLARLGEWIQKGFEYIMVYIGEYFKR